jgi:Serine carboxypeptidase
MQLPVVKEWQPWGFSVGDNVNNEIAGYVEVYSNLTLATVKAAGHEAPSFQPASAYQVFTSFLANKPLPGTR